MKKSHIVILVALSLTLISVVVGLLVYPATQKEKIKRYTYNYVAAQGYSSDTIYDVEIYHSYSGKILGYNEWRITVEFKQRPNMLFNFSYRDGRIIYYGVSSNPMMDKDDVIKYSDMFKNGTLLDEDS